MLTHFKLDTNKTYQIVNNNSSDNHWIHVEDPSNDEINYLTQTFNIPIDYLVSTLDPDEVSRSEKVKQESIIDPVLISLLYAIEDPQHDEPGNFINHTLSIILLKDCVITCVKQNPPFLTALLEGQYQLIKQPINQHSLVIELLWQIVRGYVIATRLVTSSINQLYESSKKATKSETIFRLADLDRSVIYLKMAIDENQPILEELYDAPYFINQPNRPDWLHDVLVENHQAKQMNYQTHQILQHLDTTFSSIIQNNLNEIMKVLTSLTIIITIPSITGALWGMNVGLPFMSHPFAFVIVILLTLLLMILAVFWLKKKEML